MRELPLASPMCFDGPEGAWGGFQAAPSKIQPVVTAEAWPRESEPVMNGDVRQRLRSLSFTKHQGAVLTASKDLI